MKDNQGEKPLISVIVPTFNHEKYISDCISSLSQQSLSSLEIIVIDDASTDRTPWVVEDLAKKDSRIHFIRHPINWGMYRLAETCNQGLAHSRGNYIAVLEGDDFWPEKKLEIQLPSLIENEDAVLSHGLMALINQKGEAWIPPYRWSSEISKNQPVGSILKALLLGDNPVATQTAIIRRKFLEKSGGFHPQKYPLFVFDYPTWMELALLGPFIFVPQILGFWRRYPASVSAYYYEKLWQDHIQYTKLFIENHQDRLSQLSFDLEEYLKNYSCYALLDLAKMRVINKEWKEAKTDFKRLIKSFRLIARHRTNVLKFFILTLSLLLKKDGFSPLFRFYGKYKKFRGLS